MTTTMPHVRCVVFDVDDTLYLERDYVRSGFAAVGEWACNELGVQGLGEACWAQFERGLRGDTFDRALREAGRRPTPALVASMVAVYRSHVPKIELLADAAAAIADLRRASIPIGIVTDGPLASQRAKVHALGGPEWASAIVCTAELGAGFSKPHTKAFTLIEQTCGARGDACVYVADNVGKDFIGPRSLGWYTVRVRRPGGLHAAQPSGDDVDAELPDLTSLLVSLGQLARSASQLL